MPAPVRLGLRYSLSPAGVLTAESNTNGYLRVFRRAQDGAWTSVAPAMAVAAHGSVTVQAGAGKDRRFHGIQISERCRGGLKPGATQARLSRQGVDVYAETKTLTAPRTDIEDLA
jgi:hypothetical protein